MSRRGRPTGSCKAHPKTKFGILVNLRCVELGMSTVEFARRMEISYAHAWYLQYGETRFVKYKVAKRLAKVLGFDNTFLSKFMIGARSSSTSEFGTLVKSCRLRQGLSLEDLAKKMNVSKAYMSRIEKERVSLNCSSDFVLNLAKTLRIEVSSLTSLIPGRRLKEIKGCGRLGSFIASRRIGLNLTQGDLASKADTWATMISAIENDKRVPSARILANIAKVLGCEIPPDLIPVRRKQGRPRRM